MGYTTYTRQMLADFTGRPVASFPEGFVNASAIPQALLLFKLGTCLASPDALTTDQKQLVDFAILSMADAIHLSAPYQAAMASPFNSESIGSYSYSKTAKAVASGVETGIGWFDRAIDELSVCDQEASGLVFGGIEVFEFDAAFVAGASGQNRRMLSPKDIDASRRFGWDPSPGKTYTQPVYFDAGTAPQGWTEDPENPGLYFPPTLGS